MASEVRTSSGGARLTIPAACGNSPAPASRRIPSIRTASVDHLRIIERVSLPEPLSYHTFVRRDGRRGVAVGARSGNVWMLEIDPDARTCEPHPLPVAVPRRGDGAGWDVRELSGSHDLGRLLLWTDAPRVYDLPSGQVVAELGMIPGRAVCLSPDGRWALCLGEGSGGMMDLASPHPAWRETSAFHVLQREDEAWEDVYLDHVDNIVALPAENELQPDDDFWIAAGCYGFVATHLVDVDRSRREVYPIPGDSREFGGFVYDPTELVRQTGPRHVFVSHGYGTGLAAIDPATGELHHCWIRGPRKQPYGFVTRAVPCGTAPVAWVRSGDGDFLWHVGQPPVKIPAVPHLGTPLALYPGALLCLTSGGEELLWCEVPSYSQTPSLTS